MISCEVEQIKQMNFDRAGLNLYRERFAFSRKFIVALSFEVKGRKANLISYYIPSGWMTWFGGMGIHWRFLHYIPLEGLQRLFQIPLCNMGVCSPPHNFAFRVVCVCVTAEQCDRFVGFLASNEAAKLFRAWATNS